MNLHKSLPEAEILLQVHDSLAGQYSSHLANMPERIKEHSKIIVPYEDPLIIPFSVETSEKNWGDCH
jgi:hypothetical protein